MFGVFGTVGQAAYNVADARTPVPVSHRGTGNAWLNSKWSPVKVLSDDEYEEMLREKLLRVNAEIALVNESIEALRIMDGNSSFDGNKGSKS